MEKLENLLANTKVELASAKSELGKCESVHEMERLQMHAAFQEASSKVRTATIESNTQLQTLRQQLKRSEQELERQVCYSAIIFINSSTNSPQNIRYCEHVFDFH